jgi:hypothetical protein
MNDSSVVLLREKRLRPGRLRRVRDVTMVCAAIAVLGSGSAAHDRTTPVTWTADVAPIVAARCAGCHAAGGFAPMPLATYQDARNAARDIRQEVLARRMPPWPAARGIGAFANDRSLTPLEIDLLTAWADGATPIGSAAVAASAPAAHAAERAADLVLMSEARDVTALSARIELPTDGARDRWITGWTFLPGSRATIVQATVSIGGTPLGSWTPPEPAVMFPAGVAQRLPAGSPVRLEVRYRKSASPQRDRSGVALFFGGAPPRELRHRTLACGSTALDRDVDALAVTPRVPAAGEWIEITARRPDGSVAPLSAVRRYEPAYPITYRFAKAVPLARGTTIDVTSSSRECAADLDVAMRR